MSTFSRILQSHYESYPERVSVVLQRAGHEDKPIPYRELTQGAHNYAEAYRKAGVQPGEVVVLILQHGEDLIFSFWGAVLRGAIPAMMPFLTEKLSPERYHADLKTLIGIAKPAAIVTYSEFEDEIRAILPTGGSVRQIIVASRVEPAPPPNFSQLAGMKRAPEDIALLQHSSGTTGLQKGVALSHRAALNQLQSYQSALLFDPQKDVFVSWLPLYHDMGLIAGFIMPILGGAPLILSSPFDWIRAPYRMFQSVSKYKGTLTWLPNFAYNFCAQKVRERDMEGVDLSSWRIITNASEPVKAKSHQMFYERFAKYGLKQTALQCGYGMAENVLMASQTYPPYSLPTLDEIDREAYLSERIARPAVEGKASVTMVSCGRALPNTTIRIVDEQGNTLPDRVIGEVALKSDSMLTEYYNRPDATAKAFIDGWYLSGDYGYMVNGELYVAGRKKDMIIVGGKNVYPQDLETLAYEVPGIHPGRAVAFGVFDEAAGTEDVVIVAEVDVEDPNERQKIADALRAHVTKNSAVALRYAHIVGPRWILKTSSGKTARSTNKEKFIKEAGLNQTE